jgi:hypothetical protein
VGGDAATRGEDARRSRRTIPASRIPVHGQEGDLAAAVAHAARLSDLSVVGGARYGDGGWREVRDAALFQSGRPVLVVPDEGVKESTFDRVVIAWKESIEAARAVAAAQPFLLRASEVHLITVGENAEVVASLEDVEQYLQLHYAEIKSDVIPYARGEGGCRCPAGQVARTRRRTPGDGRLQPLALARTALRRCHRGHTLPRARTGPDGALTDLVDRVSAAIGSAGTLWTQKCASSRVSLYGPAEVDADHWGARC